MKTETAFEVAHFSFLREDEEIKHVRKTVSDGACICVWCVGRIKAGEEKLAWDVCHKGIVKVQISSHIWCEASMGKIRNEHVAAARLLQIEALPLEPY